MMWQILHSMEVTYTQTCPKGLERMVLTILLYIPSSRACLMTHPKGPQIHNPLSLLIPWIWIDQYGLDRWIDGQFLLFYIKLLNLWTTYQWARGIILTLNLIFRLALLKSFDPTIARSMGHRQTSLGGMQYKTVMTILRTITLVATR